MINLDEVRKLLLVCESDGCNELADTVYRGREAYCFEHSLDGPVEESSTRALHIPVPVSLLRPMVDELEAARAEISRRDADTADAAGELLVDIPAPGTDCAKLLIANKLMRDELEAARAEVERLRTGLNIQDGGHGCWIDTAMQYIAQRDEARRLCVELWLGQCISKQDRATLYQYRKALNDEQT